MRSQVLSVLLAGAVVAGMGAAARASVYFEEDFNNLSGALTTGQTSTGGSWNVNAAAGSVNVIADPTGSGRGNVLNIVDGSSSAQSSASASLTNAVTGPVQIQFDFYMSRFGFGNELAIYMNSGSGGRVAYNRAYLPSTGTGGDGTYVAYNNKYDATTLMSNLKPGAWYTAILTLPDPAAQPVPTTMHIKIQDVGGNTVLADDDGPLFTSNLATQKNFKSLVFGQSSSPTTPNVYVDNIRITTVPEPASVCLLGLGGLLLLRRRK